MAIYAAYIVQVRRTLSRKNLVIIRSIVLEILVWGPFRWSLNFGKLEKNPSANGANRGWKSMSLTEMSIKQRSQLNCTHLIALTFRRSRSLWPLKGSVLIKMSQSRSTTIPSNINGMDDPTFPEGGGQTLSNLFSQLGQGLMLLWRIISLNFIDFQKRIKVSCFTW